MRLDAPPSVCDVVGFDEPTTATDLDTRDSQVLEFSICPVHFFRLQKGPQPVIVAERFGLSDVDGRPVLLLDWATLNMHGCRYPKNSRTDRRGRPRLSGTYLNGHRGTQYVEEGAEVMCRWRGSPPTGPPAASPPRRGALVGRHTNRADAPASVDRWGTAWWPSGAPDYTGEGAAGGDQRGAGGRTGEWGRRASRGGSPCWCARCGDVPL